MRYAEPSVACFRGSPVRTPSIYLLLMLAVVIAACAAPESSGGAATAEPSATHVDQATPQESTQGHASGIDSSDGGSNTERQRSPARIHARATL